MDSGFRIQDVCVPDVFYSGFRIQGWINTFRAALEVESEAFSSFAQSSSAFGTCLKVLNDEFCFSFINFEPRVE